MSQVDVRDAVGDVLTDGRQDSVVRDLAVKVASLTLRQNGSI
jgi:uncharacterized Zn ribbon protein